MPVPENLKDQVLGRSDKELLGIVDKPADWMPEVVTVAREELMKRNVDVETPRVKAREFQFRKNTKLTKFLESGLILSICLAVLAIIFDLLYSSSLDGHMTGTAHAFRMEILLLGIAQIIWFPVMAVSFLGWVNLANKNVRSLGAEGLAFQPNVAIACFFMPILNLWQPQQMMGELWKASQNPKFWRKIEGPFFLNLWWPLWIFNALAALFAWSQNKAVMHDMQVLPRFGLPIDFMRELQTLYYIYIFMHLIEAGFFYCTLKLISEISQRQILKHEQAEPEPASAD